MKQYKISPTLLPKKTFIKARISKVHNEINVIENTEEVIFGETFVSCTIPPNARVCKFKKNTLEYL